MFRQLVNIPRLFHQIRPISRNKINNTVEIGNNIIRNRFNIRSITYFTETHEFINYNEKEKTAKLGITYYAKNSLGEIIFIENDFDVGDNVEIEDEVLTLESTKATGTLGTPIEGKIIEYNDKLIEDLEEYNNIEIENETNYWLVNLQLDEELDTTDFLCEDEYTHFITSLDTD